MFDPEVITKAIKENTLETLDLSQEVMPELLVTTKLSKPYTPSSHLQIYDVTTLSTNDGIAFCASDQQVFNWKVGENYVNHHAKLPFDARCLVAFPNHYSGDDYMAFGATDHNIYCRFLHQEAPDKVLKGHTAPLKQLVVFPNGTLASSSTKESIIYMWTQNFVKKLDSGDNGYLIDSLVVLPNNRLAALYYPPDKQKDSHIRIWNEDGQAEVYINNNMIYPAGKKQHLSVLSNGNLVSYGYKHPGFPYMNKTLGGTVRIWDTKTGVCLKQWLTNETCQGLTILENDLILLENSSRQGYFLWDAATSAGSLEPFYNFTNNMTSVNLIAKLANNQFISAANSDSDLYLHTTHTRPLRKKDIQSFLLDLWQSDPKQNSIQALDLSGIHLEENDYRMVLNIKSKFPNLKITLTNTGANWERAIGSMPAHTREQEKEKILQMLTVKEHPKDEPLLAIEPSTPILMIEPAPVVDEKYQQYQAQLNALTENVNSQQQILVAMQANQTLLKQQLEEDKKRLEKSSHKAKTFKQVIVEQQQKINELDTRLNFSNQLQRNYPYDKSIANGLAYASEQEIKGVSLIRYCQDLPEELYFSLSDKGAILKVADLFSCLNKLMQEKSTAINFKQYIKHLQYYTFDIDYLMQTPSSVMQAQLDNWALEKLAFENFKEINAGQEINDLLNQTLQVIKKNDLQTYIEHQNLKKDVTKIIEDAINSELEKIILKNKKNKMHSKGIFKVQDFWKKYAIPSYQNELSSYLELAYTKCKVAHDTLPTALSQLENAVHTLFATKNKWLTEQLVFLINKQLTSYQEYLFKKVNQLYCGKGFFGSNKPVPQNLAIVSASPKIKPNQAC